MAQIETTLYKDIAESYADIDSNLSGVSSYARTALDAILDVTTTTYPDPSADANAALEIEIALLTVFNAAYTAAQNIAASTGAVLDAVRAVNNHVINNYGGTATATAKLAAWVNSDMLTTWTSGIPSGWKNLSEDAGYDVATWV